MVWLACDKDGTELVSTGEPFKNGDDKWEIERFEETVNLPKGSIKKLIGRELSWSDSPVEI